LAHIINRKWRRKEDGLVAAIDIGASKVACFIARIVADSGHAPHAEIIGVGHRGVASGLKSGVTTEQIENSVRSAVDAAERMAGVRINRVSVGVAGRFLRTRRIGVDLEVGGGYITEEDIADSLAEGVSVVATPECSALHAIPIEFKVDGEEFVDDPVGLNGDNLSTEMFGVGARQSVLDNLSSLIERCGLIADDFAAAPFAAAEAVLLEDEKELGVVLIDIGAASTGYAVYDNGVLVNCGGIGIGSGHITKDIAQIFGTPLAQAERVKTLHGAALIGPGDEHRFVDFPQLGIAGEIARASRADLCEVIIPRMEEIFEMVAEKLPDDGLRGSGLRRTVITGGGSLLVGAREIAERSLSMKSRLGRPMNIAGAPEAAGAPGFAVCAGLIQTYINSTVDLYQGLGAARQSPHSLRQAPLFGGVEAWLRAKF